MENNMVCEVLAEVTPRPVCSLASRLSIDLSRTKLRVVREHSDAYYMAAETVKGAPESDCTDGGGSGPLRSRHAQSAMPSLKRYVCCCSWPACSLCCTSAHGNGPHCSLFSSTQNQPRGSPAALLLSLGACTEARALSASEGSSEKKVVCAVICEGGPLMDSVLVPMCEVEEKAIMSAELWQAPPARAPMMPAGGASETSHADDAP